MASFELDNVKAEKEDALWRYNMEKNQKQTQKQAISTDIYDEYVCSSRRSIPTHAASTVDPATKETVMDKQIIFEVNVSPLFPEKQLETTVDTDTIRETKVPLSPVKQLTKTMGRTVLRKTKPAIVSSAELKEKEYRRS
ncbi:CYP722 protein [Hibiscus syriacus]|uniref:CYP722 protein n=1 Tax=Hibiscus syriacus TaxID=106335 RepID=A0A6A2YZ06_HIBSY|nr:CYP722 protein [Hibiscus syriacus]